MANAKAEQQAQYRSVHIRTHPKFVASCSDCQNIARAVMVESEPSRADRLSAAQEGVVKALEKLADFGAASLEVDTNTGEAWLSEAHSLARIKAKAALKELEEAQK